MFVAPIFPFNKIGVVSVLYRKESSAYSVCAPSQEYEV